MLEEYTPQLVEVTREIRRGSIHQHSVAKSEGYSEYYSSGIPASPLITFYDV